MDRIRERTDADVDAIVSWIPDAGELYRFAGPGLSWPLTAAQMHDSAAAPGRTAWVLEVDRRVSGHAQLTRSASAVRLGRVLIDPALRGRGYGRLLVSEVIELVRREGAQRVDLSVLVNNVPAQRLYLALGFLPAAEPPAADMLTMSKDLM